jgi:hypothetical protein
MIGQICRMELKPRSVLLVAFCAAILFWTAAYPFGRAFLLTQINPDEGWNVYNAQKVAEHQPLYPSAYAWTALNYPALSFHLVAALGRLTSDYLFTARILSLSGLCLNGVLAGLIVWQTTRVKLAAWLAGPFLVAIFCANATDYVGMNDPQMLAQVFSLAGLYVYLRGNRRGWALDLTALLFVLGGNIKHNVIEFPLAVLLDLLFCSPRRALRFGVGGALMAGLSVVLTSRIDGAAYFACLLAPRGYSTTQAILQVRDVFLPILLPTAAAWWMACSCWKNPSRRVLALLLICALAIDTYFSGGSGVSINAMFGSTLAIVLLNGVFWAEFSRLPLGGLRVLPLSAVCAVFFLCLAIPMKCSYHVRTMRILQTRRNDELRFTAERDYLRQQHGAALCESLLLCYYAGKPYLYDPFNATRFIGQGRLDANLMVDRVRNHEFGAVQLYGSVEERLGESPADEYFASPILRAIQLYYRPGFKDQDGIIYIPRTWDAQMRPKLAKGY